MAWQSISARWVPISTRLASAQLKGTTVNLNFVADYAPTLGAAEEAKDSFYGDLQDAVDRVSAGDMLIVAGDWNARPGPVDGPTRYILGKFALALMVTTWYISLQQTALWFPALAFNTHNATF